MSAATHEHASPISAAAASSTSGRRPAITTRAPHRISSAAAAFPRFVPPPVTITTRPSSAPSANTREASTELLTHHLDHEPLRPAAVELAVEHLLPRAEIEPSIGDRNDHLVVDEQV